MANQQNVSPEIEAVWRDVLTKGHRSRLAVLPSNPRCLVCSTPFGGVGGVVARLGKRGPSRKNPNMCNLCDDILPVGGAEVDIAVLFADVRGSTALGEHMGAGAFAGLLNRFYAAATSVLVDHRAIIDKMLGDEVMAFFLPARAPTFQKDAVLAAEGLLRAVGYGSTQAPWLPLGVAVHTGTAFVGKIGSGGVHDFTVLGDTVNTAARLQAEAQGGEVVLSDTIYQYVADRYPSLEQRTVSVRGREQPVVIRVMRLDS
ncbi:MAG: adenylate/guanylate cyclase domain-containing protein [Chloroflexi bacterium]|nr:adenylate/guanylate cyclase domain-containing protein [Chloroflexota bacterium]